MEKRSLRRVLTRAQAGVLVVILATLGFFGATSKGFPLTKLDLHDTGVWISNDADGFYGRLNKAALGLDATPSPPGQRLQRYSLDILQDRHLVAGWDQSAGKLTAINTITATSVVDDAVDLPQGTLVQLRGGTLAVMDLTGRVWAMRYAATDQVLDVRRLELTGPSIADLELQHEQPETALALAVGADGTIYAAAASGRVVRVPVTAQGGFDKPVVTTGSALKSIQLAAVGRDLVLYDAVAGSVQLPSGTVVDVAADPQGKLQESSDVAKTVLVAASTGLDRISLADGAVDRVDRIGGGAPARPVRLGGCDFAAWAGAGHYVRACDGLATLSENVDRTGGLVRPVFRVNHGLIALNDQATGRAFDLDTQSSLDNWSDVRPQSRSDQAETKQEADRGDAKPTANNDDLKARPDRATVLHVLDNDTDTGGGILMIKAVSGVAPGVQVAIAPDAQTLKIVLPSSVPNTSFRYQISNGSAQAEATVTVALAGTPNKPPKSLGDSVTPTYTVPSFGTLSIPVTGGWRDAEGDPVAVVAAKDDQGQVVPVTADGRLEFTAARADKRTTRRITYEVTDGTAAPVQGSVTVNVLGATEARSVPPVAQPDTADGQVGRPVTVWPLLNDVPGADPRNPQAKLVLRAQVPQRADVQITTDLKSGQVTVVGRKAGSYFLEYQAAFGGSAPAKGTIRVDIAATAAATTPVAMPDQAALHGQAAVLVDVLANDVDPAGGLLTVSAVVPADPGQLSVAVIGGRWARIVPTVDVLSPNSQVLRYTISNGSQSATGDIVVTQLAGIADDRPLVRDDFAVVRAGDSVLIPVLDNDSSLSGAPLTLATNISGVDAAGQLRVIDPTKAATENQGEVGAAVVHNNQVRYLPPAQVDALRQVQIEYMAVTASGDTAVGHATVSITPPPATPEADQAPVPSNVEWRLASGSRVSIPIPTSGADPDGDTVTVSGLTSAPKLGRVVGFSPSSITYEAYPTAGAVGTDTFTYQVSDPFGRTGEASVRLAVVAPGQTQPPVAIDDAVTARPGAKVQLNVVANDLVSRDDAVAVAPLDSLNSSLPPGVRLAGARGPILADVPAAGAQPATFLYALKGNGGTGPSASVSITSKPGYLNPPTVVDQTAEIDGKNATADLLAGAWDADGDLASLRVTLVGAASTATLTGSKVTVPLTPRAQTLPFKVSDADGAVGVGVLYVPAAGSGAPIVKPGALLEIGQNQTLTAALADFVTSPRNRAVKIASATLVGTPADGVAAQAVDADRFTLASKNDYVGPAAVVLEVMDATSQTDPDVLKATLSIPVQVGPNTPVLRCPSDPVSLVQGGEAKELDIATLCHVWAPDPAAIPSIAYTATWARPLTDVSAKAVGGTVTLQAGANALGGASGAVTVGVAGTASKTADIPVTVIEAPRPTMQSQTIGDVKQGSSVDVPLGLSSPLLRPQPTIIEVKQVSGPHARESHTGTVLTFTPDADASGTVVFSVTASDLADRSRTNRFVTRNITLVVYGKPDAPSAPQPGNTVQSGSVALTWPAPKSNGAPIDQYRVVAGNGTSWIFQSTAGGATGLKNGNPVTFQVQAHNKGGWSDLGPASRPVTPNEAPGAVSGVTAANPQDGALTLSWGAPRNAGSEVTAVHVAWQGGSKDLAGNPTSTEIRGLDNNTLYTFTVWAENSYQPGPNATGTGQSSGKPLGLSVAAPVPVGAVGAATEVSVGWSAADPNGPGPVTYSVQRSDGKKICSGVTATSCVDDTVTFDGTTHAYTVTAVNATGEPHSAQATSASWKATGTPDRWGPWTLSATGSDGGVHLSYSVPPARGAASTVTILLDGSPHQTFTAPPGGGAGTKDLSGLTNGRAYSIGLQVCNENGTCSASNTQSVTPFGPLGTPVLTATISGRTTAVSARGDARGAPATLTLTSSTGHAPWSTTGTGVLTITAAEDLDWAQTATYSVTITSGATTPSRTSPVSGASQSVTAPQPPAPSVDVQQTGINGQNVSFRVTADGNGVDGTTINVSGCAGDAATVGAGGWARDYTCSPGWGTTATLAATVTSRGGSRTANASGTTGPAPNPQVHSSLGPACSTVWPGCPYPSWYTTNMSLSGWNPNSTVSCWVGSTQQDLASWSGTFTVDGGGNWGPQLLSSRNSSGYLLAASAGELIRTADCHQN